MKTPAPCFGGAVMTIVWIRLNQQQQQQQQETQEYYDAALFLQSIQDACPHPDLVGYKFSDSDFCCCAFPEESWQWLNEELPDDYFDP
jgi:hypothetical protein